MVCCCAASVKRSLFLAIGWIYVFAAPMAYGEPGPTASTLVSTQFRSQDQAVRFETDFPGGKIDRLIEYNGSDFEIVIRPEADDTNDSAWYAFRVQSTNQRDIKVRLRYEGGSHRYEPKISYDRTNWESAQQLVVARHPGGSEVTLKIPVSDRAVWIAGQELVSNKDIANWIEQLRNQADASKILGKENALAIADTTIGTTVDGRNLYQMSIGNAQSGDSIFILSRQHPPEVTGTIGMMHFVEAICADTELAKAFRDKFHTSVVPIANPDGVAKGYWRANANGVDLNRDWMNFTQPETKAIHDELIKLNEHKDGRLWLFLDFHSTYNEVFYTMPRENDLFPSGFTTEWLAALDERMPTFDVLRDDGHNAHRSTSKAWVARELGIHAITYEFGDETDRDRIRNIAAKSAEEMMRLLLKRKSESVVSSK
ncbi:Zinc carboxypeptidase [Rubripirellula tenax]|uniref:Zinc carboxypeptidase n=1 Tax=Rubripirellula tenax TaxID=2528015 RepID=A0A5C6FM86_9BACT|nr:M14-type cytosolic carboxypeptidase [Rubripirellula tenax]TWU60612.1 Zinc carboxypeptidase [Rubripirellula tenax]